MGMIKHIGLSVLILTQLGCENEKSEVKNTIDKKGEFNLKESLKRFAIEIKSKDSNRIRAISTEVGFSSLMLMTDSLRIDSNINDLSENLRNFNVAAINKWNDSMVCVSLGKLNEKVGATGGYIVLNTINEKYKINEFRAGK